MLDYQDTFKLIKRISLSSKEVSLLTELYLPIIGVDSFSLYMLFATLNEKENYLIKKLLDNLNFHHAKDLDQAMSKLEALGLLKRFQNKENHLAFEMLEPLSYEAYFSIPLLSEYLTGQIGLDESNKLKAKSEKKTLKGYKEVTKSFDEVYETSDGITANIYSHLNKKLDIDNIVLKEVDFDYVFFKMSFEDEALVEVLNDSDFKKKILEVSHVYHLNEEEMKEVVLNTINYDKELTFDYISKNARNLYRKKTNAELVKLETKADDKFIASSLDDETFKIVNWLENASFADVLKMLSGITPSQSELKMFEELKENTKFSNGMINTMILYVSTILDGQIPGYNYFEKIANVWARANIKNTLDAHKYVIDALNKKPEQKKYNHTNKVASPTWYDEYLKEVEESKNQEQKELSDDELKKIFEEADL